MSKMIKWPSIEQFRNVIKNVQHKACYQGQDENGNVIYNWAAIKPVLRFEGTIKLHGTNAAVASSIADLGQGHAVWCQSRENIITPEQDNAGFATFVHAHKDEFIDLLVTANSRKRTAWGDYQDIIIFGEWCGGNIQKSVALAELPKMFVIFGMAKVDAEGNKNYFTRQEVIDVVDGCREYVWKAEGKIPEKAGIYCIWDFPTYHIDIDFEHPEQVQNQLGALTISVETTCPVAAQFGVMGIGEGIVWRCVEPGWEDSGFWFKVKGSAHSVSKVKTLAAVDIEKVNNIAECVEKVCTEQRMQQMWDKMHEGTPEGWSPDMVDIGPFLKALAADVFKEEMDTIVESGLEPKDIGKEISNVGRRWFVTKI